MHIVFDWNNSLNSHKLRFRTVRVRCGGKSGWQSGWDRGFFGWGRGGCCGYGTSCRVSCNCVCRYVASVAIRWHRCQSKQKFILTPKIEMCGVTCAKRHFRNGTTLAKRSISHLNYDAFDVKPNMKWSWHCDVIYRKWEAYYWHILFARYNIEGVFWHL